MGEYTHQLDTGQLRKRFLTWRAVMNEDRGMLLERGRKILGGEQAAPSDLPSDASEGPANE